MCDISVVVPVFNEKDNLEPLMDEIATVLDESGKSYEMVFVDDCSTDGSLAAMLTLARDRKHLEVVAHRINVGQSGALISGFKSSIGQIVVTLDADGQNDPADIPGLLKELDDKRADAVCGIRANRRDTFVKRVSSRIANAFRNVITGDDIQDTGCAMRAIRRRALQEILPFNGLHRFLPTILRLQGFKVVQIPVNHRPRLRGVSKYGVNNRLWRGIADCFAMRWYAARCLPAERIDRTSVSRSTK